MHHAAANHYGWCSLRASDAPACCAFLLRVILTASKCAQHPNFSFNAFYEQLNKRGLCIYPGKVTQSDCFRIGNIGQLYPADMHALLQVGFVLFAASPC